MKKSFYGEFLNQHEIFANVAQNWFKLVNYGEYAHRLGMQVVTKDSAREMTKSFHSLMQRFARKFRGVPVYIGHPDDAHFCGQTGHGDMRAYGWVQDLDAKDDGLWVKVKWSSAGEELLANEHFKFLSPRWEMQSLGNGRFAPKNLISIGLTNHPNIETEAFVNVEEDDSTAPCDNDAMALLPAACDEAGEMPLPDRSAPTAIRANTANLAQEIFGRGVFSQDISLRITCNISSKKIKEQQVLNLVSERMSSANENFSDAWKCVKNCHPALF
ncbi:MAG: phage protease [Puniceicoccales bacterium]|nr:phage protease [Puniceicoccales bacterium]